MVAVHNEAIQWCFYTLITETQSGGSWPCGRSYLSDILRHADPDHYSPSCRPSSGVDWSLVSVQDEVATTCCSRRLRIGYRVWKTVGGSLSHLMRLRHSLFTPLLKKSTRRIFPAFSRLWGKSEARFILPANKNKNCFFIYGSEALYRGYKFKQVNKK